MYACIYIPNCPSDSQRLLRECAQAFAPEAELATPQSILFEVSRLNRLYGSLENIAESIDRHARWLGLLPHIAIASTVETAALAARNFNGINVIPEAPAEAIADLGVETLPITPQTFEILESWGIRKLSDLADLSENGIAERLGPEGVYLQNLARGTADRPLRVTKPEITFEDRADLEHALTNLEPLLFIIARILNEQCEKLEAHGMAANELHLTLNLEGQPAFQRQLRLPVPMRQSKAMLKLLQLDLEAHPPQAPILAIHLLLKPVQPRTFQAGIFLPVTPAPDKLEITLARIRALVGEENVGVPELINTHRPCPFRLVSRQPRITASQGLPKSQTHIAFRYFQPPLKATVELVNGRPLRLAAGPIRGNVVTWAGPWRSSGDWWTDNPWNRDEWDVSLSDGAIYRIYRQPDASWFLEGTYD